MAKRFEVHPFAARDVAAAADLLATRHRRHRQTWPGLDPAYEDPMRCAPLIEELMAREGALGAMARSGDDAAGYVLMTRRPSETSGPNAWAEDAGSAGDGEAIREAYAAIAGELVDSGIRGHWAMVPASDASLVDAWFSLSFGLQQVYALREPTGTDFRPATSDGLTIRRPTSADVPTMAELDVVLPNHVARSPVFSKVPPRAIHEIEAELAEDIKDAKYEIFLAEHGGRVVSEVVGLDVAESTSWTAMMRPRSCALLGYGATLPDARGLGAARVLTEAFMAWARDRDFEWLATDWRSTNLEANRTWRTMGFRPAFYRLHRMIA